MRSTVRTADSRDISTLVGLMEEFYAEAAFPLDRAWAAAAFTALLARPELGVTWLLLHDDTPAGYLVLTTRFSMEFGGLDGFVDDLFVRPSFRQQGLGRKALHVLFHEARRRGVSAVHVIVGRDNSVAQALYRSVGLELPRDGREMLSVRVGAVMAPHEPSAHGPAFEPDGSHVN